jgi:Arc/MetJ-type ribon-helix-helix transcriptional regulator
MTHLTITRPDTAQAYIDEQLASGTYSSADELLTALIEDTQERHAKQKVNAMLRSTLQKNKTIEATDEWWETQRAQLIRPSRAN